MKTLLLIAALTMTACAAKPDGEIPILDFEAYYPCDMTLPLTPDDGRPDILVIGDSISMGYTPYMRTTLTSYDVSHNACNAMSTKSGMRHIDEWLDQRTTWDAITFNHGLWDIADWMWVGDDEYAANLHVIAQKIKARTAHPLFLTSTEILPGTLGRLESNVIDHNAVAVAVMQAEGIPVFDLHAVSLTLSNEHVSPTDGHFNAYGYQTLGQAVTDELFNLYGIQ